MGRGQGLSAAFHFTMVHSNGMTTVCHYHSVGVCLVCNAVRDRICCGVINSDLSKIQRIKRREQNLTISSIS